MRWTKKGAIRSLPRRGLNALGGVPLKAQSLGQARSAPAAWVLGDSFWSQQ